MSDIEAPSREATDYDPAHDAHADVDHDHPTELTYIKVGAALFFITLAEVLTYTFSVRGVVLAALLLPMMALKFGIVAAYFMHLRFDSRLFTRVFVTGIILAIAVYIIVLTTLHVFE
jgi:cytochrome c oxidase subunit 4